ncbi:MAG TPA: hypothetical protein PLT25_11675, partial [Acidocella sp.]|nr:hypothetical protein [Acidocella sp.]
QLTKSCGASFVRARYAGFEGNKVRLENGKLVEFDRLSISTGAKPSVSSVKPIRRLTDRIDHWDRLPAPKIGVIGGGAAGVEIVLALRARLNRHAKIHLQIGRQQLLPNAPRRARIIALEALKTAGISVNKSLPLPIDDVIEAYTPEPDIAVRPTLQLLDRDDVFAAGDCAAFPKPLPRSGAIAVRQGKILAYNLTHKKLKNFRPPRRTLAILSLSPTRAVAWYGSFCWAGWLPMLLKKWLDQSWLQTIWRKNKPPRPPHQSRPNLRGLKKA